MPLAGNPSPIQVVLLGGARLQMTNGETVSISGKKALAMIAYLCRCQGMAASRDKLAGLLWSDADNQHAKNSLRQTLAVLRRELSRHDHDFLLSRHDVVALRPSSVVCDVHRFVRAAAATGSNGDGRVVAEAYAGPFLEGFFSGSDVFEDWAAAEREKLANVAVVALERLARQTSGQNGLDFARRLLSVEPAREGSHRLMMELLAANGHRDLALRQYDLCKEMLRKEFEVRPDPETELVRQAIASSSKVGFVPELKVPEFADRTQQSMAQRPSVDVQLFTNLTQDKIEEFFSRALVQAIITELSQHRALVVRTEQERSNIQSDTATVAEISPQLGVRYILSGSVQKTSGRLRVGAQLIDAASGDHVWAERYDGSADESLEFQVRVAQSIAFAARVQLLLTGWKVRDMAPSDDPEARVLVNRAVVRYYEMTKGSLLAAAALAERALQIDPASARAMRTLSLATSVGMAFGARPKTSEDLKRVIGLAETAVAAVPDDEIARYALSFALLSAGRLNEAVAELRYALALNPRFPNAHGDIAEIYAFLGQADEAIAEAREAIRLSSHDPADFWRYYSLSVAQFGAGDDVGALESARHVHQVQARFCAWRPVLGCCGCGNGQCRGGFESGRGLSRPNTRTPPGQCLSRLCASICAGRAASTFPKHAF